MGDIGRMLTEARTTRGVTLEQAERETRIVRRYLVALEAEDFAAFPAEVYARGFLRSYAAYLGLNPAEVLAMVPPATAGAGTPGGAGRAPRSDRSAGRGGAPVRVSPRRTPLTGAAAASAGIVLVAFVLGQLAGGGSSFGSPADIRARGPAREAGIAAGGGAVAARMPDLRGLDEAQALARLAAMGVTPFVIELPSREAPPGQVLRQSPAPNATIGTRTVTVVVSRGG
jgi:hypothetical protein